MAIKYGESVNPESVCIPSLQSPNEDRLHYKETFPIDEDMILRINKAGVFSKATSDTRNTRQDQSELSSLREEEISVWESAAAKAKLPKLHGRNYGRSLTLEMDDEVLPFLASKWIWLVLLLVVVLGGAGVMLLHNDNGIEVIRTAKGKTKTKTRKASKR